MHEETNIQYATGKDIEFRNKRAEKIRKARAEVNRKFRLMQGYGFTYEEQAKRFKQAIHNKIVPMMIYKKLNFNGLENKIKSFGI